MDPQRLKEKMELKIAPIKVGLRHEAVHRGKQIEDLTLLLISVGPCMMN